MEEGRREGMALKMDFNFGALLLKFLVVGSRLRRVQVGKKLDPSAFIKLSAGDERNSYFYHAIMAELG